MDAPMTVIAFEDRPPESDRLTAYDESHLAVYIRLLDADAEGAGASPHPEQQLHNAPPPAASTSPHG